VPLFFVLHLASLAKLGPTSGTPEPLRAVLCHKPRRDARELRPYHFMRRTGPDRIVSFTELYRFMEPGELFSGTTHPSLKEAWEVASPESFAPQNASEPGNIMLAAE
jgi:hypothetical protein